MQSLVTKPEAIEISETAGETLTVFELRVAKEDLGRVMAAGQTAASASLDFLLYNRGQSPSYEAANPRHRTRTVFY